MAESVNHFVAGSDEIMAVIGRVNAAWKLKRFEGLESCFHSNAVIVGPGYTEYARGREACAQSYREFAMNADVLDNAESGHALHIFETTAVYTFAWAITYRRTQGAKSEQGTDQIVLERAAAGWQIVWRYIQFQPAD